MARAIAWLVVCGSLYGSLPATAQPIPNGGLRQVAHGPEMEGTGTSLLPLKLRSTCVSGEALVWDGDSWECADVGGVTGTGTANTVVKWTGVGAVGNSQITDDGATAIGIGNASSDVVTTPGMWYSSRDTGVGLDVDGSTTLGNTSADTLVVSATSTFNGNLVANGNNTIGSAAEDAHTLNGTLNANSTAGTQGEVLTIDSGGLPKWAPLTVANGAVENYAASATTVQDIAISATANIVYVTTTGANTTIGGIAGGVNGRTLWLFNRSSNVLILDREAAGSTAANRIWTPADQDLQLTPRSGVLLYYDGTEARWMAMASDSTRFYNVTTTANVSVGTSASITTTLTVGNGATLGDSDTDTHTINGAVTITDNATIGNDATDVHTVTGTTTFNQSTTFNGIYNTASDTYLDYTEATGLYVTGNAQLGDDLSDFVAIKGKVETDVHYTGTAPTISSCGTSPSVVGNNRRGRITAGSGASSCTATFATTWASTPVCTMTIQGTGTWNSGVWISAISTSAFTVTPVSGSTLENTGIVHYHCDGI